MKKSKKQRRLIIRSVILIILFSLVGYALFKNLNQDKGPQLNDSAPNFELENLKGERVQLKDLRGKVVLVNFWGTWCKPCEKEMPAIQAAYDKYRNQGFEVLAINIQESDFLVNKYTQQRNLTFPVLLDKTGSIKDEYNVYKIPSSFFIDKKGKIVKLYEGEMDEDKFDGWIEELLQ
jgi:peroxiredoxin